MRHYLERKAKKEGLIVAGCDEVGRGCLAGPVVACCVILDLKKRLKGVKDSKELKPQERERLVPKIKSCCLDYSLALVGNKKIDEINIKEATILAMKKAIDRLKIKPDLVLIDGFNIPDLGIENIGIIKGDKKVLSIACASILAKVCRDKIMRKFHQYFPNYFFYKNKGYPTKVHRQAIKKYGPTILHRLSFL